MESDSEALNSKGKKLEEKAEKDYSDYRLKRLLEILLEADLKRLDELCQRETDKKISSLKNNLTNSV